MNFKAFWMPAFASMTGPETLNSFTTFGFKVNVQVYLRYISGDVATFSTRSQRASIAAAAPPSDCPRTKSGTLCGEIPANALGSVHSGSRPRYRRVYKE